MTSVASYRREECDTVFDSQQELIQHEILQDIEDRVFAGNDRSITKSKIEQSVISTSFITILLLVCLPLFSQESILCNLSTITYHGL